MTANVQPIYSISANIDSGANHNAGTVIGPSANTAQDGSGSNIYWVWQSNTTNGGYLQKIKFRAVGSPAATVARIFICADTSGSFTGGSTNTATNTWLLEEISLPATTLSQTAQSASCEINFGYAIPIGYKVLVAFGTSTGSAGTGYSVVAIGGNY